MMLRRKAALDIARKNHHMVGYRVRGVCESINPVLDVYSAEVVVNGGGSTAARERSNVLRWVAVQSKAIGVVVYRQGVLEIRDVEDRARS